ncbi:MAG: hypothetical protein ABJZ55_12170 [Fuerstiella sp.]
MPALYGYLLRQILLPLFYYYVRLGPYYHGRPEKKTVENTITQASQS